MKNLRSEVIRILKQGGPRSAWDLQGEIFLGGIWAQNTYPILLQLEKEGVVRKKSCNSCGGTTAVWEINQ